MRNSSGIQKISELARAAHGFAGRILDDLLGLIQVEAPARSLLPPEYLFAHRFCFDLHDRLVSLVVEGEESQVFNFRVVFESEAQADQFSKVPNDQILGWLDQHGFQGVLKDALMKRVYPALLADLCNFVHESLMCSQKGKIAVSYSLMRKPFRDNLYYLELLLVEPDKLLETLFRGDPNDLYLNPAQDGALETTRRAIATTANPGLHDAQFIYDLRYEKACDYGFEQRWQRALHIVTTHWTTRMEAQSLNFVFEGPDSFDEHWDHLYALLPFLLFYTVDVAEALMAEIVEELPGDFAVANLHRKLGMLIWMENRFPNSLNQSGFGPDQRRPMLSWPCPACGEDMTLRDGELRVLYDGDEVRCGSCGRSADLHSFAAA